MKKYTQEVTVTESHLDQLQHVNNVQYLQWVQDIAGAHWQSLIKGSKETFGLWVVRSHHIEYKRQAKLGDVLLVETHVALTEGFLSERKVRFYSTGTKNLVAQCVTQWCYLDHNTQKLLRIPQNIMDLFAQ
ncbi:MAG: acyl-CoA thioesterase [Flavobacteriales bacterium]|nr:thioesterase [Flavobacteriaceae bacterium]MDO7581258.1 thioesterase [Flavobacteriaceae bacterium]MDO7591977.1 thioesterase [Flavobacteriaceae bacterium]MDO7603148.1 thioesterase [Flavobacteriaceae bacterium]MDO7616426.1 thioesterase [Flavobacteriaceae bacterium]